MKRLLLSVAAAAMIATSAVADYTFVVPQRAGQGTTVWAEIIAKELEPFLGESITIKMLPGARDIPGFNEWHNEMRDDDKTVMVSHGGNGVSFLQENVDYDWDATTRLKQLKPARFNWISDDTNTLLDGFIAHEVSSVVPEAISGNKDATETLTNVVKNADGSLHRCNFSEAEWTKGKAEGVFAADSTWAATYVRPDYQSIDQSKLVPLLVKTIQELEARITALES